MYNNFFLIITISHSLISHYFFPENDLPVCDINHEDGIQQQNINISDVSKCTLDQIVYPFLLHRDCIMYVEFVLNHI